MTGSARIPLVDLGIQHEQIAAEVSKSIQEVIASGAFIGGPDVRAFENEYAQFVGAKHCIGVGNGTDAVELALRAAGVGPGSEVILPTNSFIATAEAVVRAGCTPVLVDCDPEYHLIDPAGARTAVSANTGAIIAVDLYGQIAPFEALESLGLPVIEDAAQSQGAKRNGKAAGTFGIAAGTSFYPGKNLGAFGDAGAVITNDDQVAHCVRALGSHGGTLKYEHRIVGMNSRLDTIQAAVLRTKLKHLDKWNTQRRVAAGRYQDLLADVGGIRLPKTLSGNSHVWHLFVIEVPERTRLLSRLESRGVGVGIHYPTPIHLTEAFSHLGYVEGDFPVAEAAAKGLLTLPLFPGVTQEQQQRVAGELIAGLA